MELDDEVCLCFHVTKRKVLSYLRIEKPQRAAQLSECYGAGTGCGWCRKYLKHLFESGRAQAIDRVNDVSADDYASARRQYIADGKGTPPGGN
ncbi:MAG: (2Fe-2S)-binding protein [Planctomycetales bacterium]|nr:(2Fe-2S)-binding protein [Planctomycetales bacterium]